MNNRLREYFHLIWLAAITVCVIAALFAVLFTSCTKAPDSGTAKKPAAVTETTVPEADAAESENAD